MAETDWGRDGNRADNSENNSSACSASDDGSGVSWERSAFSENTIEYVLAGETHTPVDGSTVSDGKFSIQPSAEWIFDVSDPKKVRVGVWVGGVLLSYTPHNIHLASQLLVLSYLCLWIDENMVGRLGIEFTHGLYSKVSTG
jgi:hypothetical protein